MVPTETQEAQARLDREAALSPIVDAAFAMAVAAEIALTGERSNRQYEAGKIDALVAVLKKMSPSRDWLAEIRMAAVVERSA